MGYAITRPILLLPCCSEFVSCTLAPERIGEILPYEGSMSASIRLSSSSNYNHGWGVVASGPHGKQVIDSSRGSSERELKQPSCIVRKSGPALLTLNIQSTTVVCMSWWRHSRADEVQVILSMRSGSWPVQLLPPVPQSQFLLLRPHRHTGPSTSAIQGVCV